MKVCRHIREGTEKDNGTGLCWACGANHRAEQELTGGDPTHWDKVFKHLRQIRGEA